MPESPVPVCGGASVPYNNDNPSLSISSTTSRPLPETSMEGAVPVSPDTLVSMLSGHESGSTLVLDSRPFISFNQGHVAGALNVHCPPIVKRRSGGLLPVENMVPGRRERERLEGGGYSSVVVYDQGTEEVRSGGAGEGSDLMVVLSSLGQQMRMMCVQPAPRLCYLAGGYDAFSEQCPFLCATQQFSPLTSGRPDTHRPSPQDEQPVEILPHLLLGSGRHSSDLDLLQRLGVTALVNVSRDCPNHFPSHFRYLHIPVRDSASADLTAWFPQANAFIDGVRAEGGRVLVHCQAGRSRSATICLAYLMKTLTISLDHAFEHVRSRRQVIDPNLNFMRQLQDYEQKLQQERFPVSGAPFLLPFTDSSFPQQSTSPRTPRQAVAPISLPSVLELGLLPPADSLALIPPPSPATASDVQFFFASSSPEFSPSGGSLARTPEIPLPS